MELEFEKYCKVGRSPRTVLPAPRHKLVPKEKKMREKARIINDQLEEGSTKIKLHYHRSFSCKSLPPTNVKLDENQVKRRAVYVSSSEIGFQALHNTGCRKKIEYSLAGHSSFSFSVLDSVCGSEQGGDFFEEKIQSVMMSPNWSTACSSKSSTESSSRYFADPALHCSNDEPPRMSLCIRQKNYSKCSERDHIEYNCQLESDPVAAHSSSINLLEESDTFPLSKCQSVKHGSPSSPTCSEGYFSKHSPESRISPFRRILGSITKSKSLHSPLSSSIEEERLAQLPRIMRNDKMPKKSLLNGFSSTVQNLDSYSVSMMKQKQEEQQRSVACQCSPVHLHGLLKLDEKHGVPYLEFSMKHPEELLVAKTWKSEDTFSWVYTFHSLQSRKNSNMTGWGMKHGNKDSPMIGQMKVFSYLGWELKDEGKYGSMMVNEFILYDIPYAGRRPAEEEKSDTSDNPGVLSPLKAGSGTLFTEMNDLFDHVMLKSPSANALDDSCSGFSSPYPWTPVDLHPSTEIGAIIVQVPFEKRESLKYKMGDEDDSIHSNLFSSSLTKEANFGILDGIRSFKVNAITTMGKHGLPTTDSDGPSPLLERWRLGGGCDCGGWDMACPLLVFDNPKVQCTEGNLLLGSQEPFQLFIQGARETIPSLSIRATERGQYSVDFHARLSSLQAFAICVAILHVSEPWTSTELEKRESPIKTTKFHVEKEDEVKLLGEAFAEEELKEARKARTAVKILPYFMVNPPFSPVSRV